MVYIVISRLQRTDILQLEVLAALQRAACELPFAYYKRRYESAKSFLTLLHITFHLYTEKRFLK